MGDLVQRTKSSGGAIGLSTLKKEHRGSKAAEGGRRVQMMPSYVR